MNSFFKYLQPTIIRASYDESMPEELRGRFFINFNVFGIDYFEEHYILTENSNNFQYLMLTENSGMFMLEDSLESEDVVDIPRIYIDITDEFVNDTSNMFKSFVWQATLENKIWAQGIDGFLAGKQYYLNNTLYNYLAMTNQMENTETQESGMDLRTRLPNYLDSFGYMTPAWMDISGEPYKDYNNLEYFAEKNKILDHTYSEDELNNFYSTFCKIILEETLISDETMLTGNNQIYKHVLNYYANFMNDEGSNAIAMILNTLYSTSTNANCNCSSKYSQETTYSTQTCYDMYKTAMGEWAKKMFADPQFYLDWFRIDMNGKQFPNDNLTAYLRLFIKEFTEMQNVLTFAKRLKGINCNCPSVSVDENECNYGILNNFLTILGYVDASTIENNKNKIKIYGSSFAELLPKLQF